MKKLAVVLACSAAIATLSGCASFPENYNKSDSDQSIKERLEDGWGSVPAVSFVQSKAGVAVRKYNQIPDSILNAPIKVAFNPTARPTVADVLFLAGAQGFRVVPRLTDPTLAKPWSNMRFEGTLGDLLEDLGAQYDLAFEYRNNTVYPVEANRFAAAMPQHEEFLKAVAGALKEMGGMDVRSDVRAGMVYYSARPEVAGYLQDYLETIAKNAAMVTLQVAVLSVTVDREVNLGFDWAKFAVMRGSGGMTSDLSSIFQNGPTGVNNGGVPNGGGANGGATSKPNTSTGGGTNANATANANTNANTGNPVTDLGHAVVATTQKAVTGSLLQYAGGGFGYKFANDAFSLTAAVRALSTYGNAKTEQNVVLGTLSGIPVKLSSGDDIPYVKSVGAATAAGGAVAGSSQTDIIKSGLKLEVVPAFDSGDGSLIAQIKVDLATLVGFRELSAGANLGTLSQPQIKNLTFENTGRLNAGETVVVGGVTYEQLSNNYSNFPGMENLKVGSKAEKVSRNSIYIVIRPTVVVFTPNAGEMNAKLAALKHSKAAAQPVVGDAR